MTSIDFKRLLQEAKAQAITDKADVANTQQDDEAYPAQDSSKKNNIIRTNEDINRYAKIIGPVSTLKLTEKFQVGKEIISKVSYIPNYVTKQEETDLLECIYSCCDKWVQLKKRRLQNWGGSVTTKGLDPDELPPWFNDMGSKLISSDVFSEEYRPNHLLINEYILDQGIMPHKDGPAYYPQVAILSLKGTVKIEFVKSPGDKEPLASLILEPRSLFIFSDDAYQIYFHVIRESRSELVDDKIVNSELPQGTEIPRGERISLTIRHVPLAPK